MAAPESSTAYKITRAVVRIVVPLLGGLTVRGGENIPDGGPVILAPNHVAVMDPPYLSLITRRQLRMMAKEELFRPRIFGPYLHALGAFPVRRGTADRAALRRAVELLKEGHLVGIFPEGTRSDGTFLRPAEKGFALIARQTGAQIVPVAIEGTERIMPRGSKRPHRGRVQISVGRPFTAQEVLARPEARGRDALTAIGEATMAAIAGLMSAPRPISEAPEKSLEKSPASP